MTIRVFGESNSITTTEADIRIQYITVGFELGGMRREAGILVGIPNLTIVSFRWPRLPATAIGTSWMSSIRRKLSISM